MNDSIKDSITVYEKPTCSKCREMSTLLKHPDLMQRPTVEKGKRAVLGRPTENVNILLE